MSSLPESLKITFTAISILLLIAALFFLPGSFGKKRFQEHAVAKAQIELEQYFESRDEALMRVASSAYKYDGVEFEVYTNRNIYYAFIVVENSSWETETVLSFVAKPKLKIHMVEPKYGNMIGTPDR